MKSRRQDRSQQESKESFDEPQTDSREEEHCNSSSLKEDFVRIYTEVENGFTDQAERSDDIEDYWDCYNCELNHRQFYSGTSEVYVPIVYDALEARKTRFTNQLFPKSQRYVDVISEDGRRPSAIMSLLEYYARTLKLQTEFVPALIKSGDVEGQYTVYVSWEKTRKEVAYRVEKPVKDKGLINPAETTYDIVEETVIKGRPSVEIISDCDFIVLPANAKSIDDALANGGSATVIRRWSKAKIKKMIAQKHIDKKAGEALLKDMTSSKQKYGQRDTEKNMQDAAGIKSSGGSKTALIYETWTRLKVKGKTRTYRIYYGGPARVLSCKRNPNWSDEVPIISCAVDKVKGAFKGRSKVARVASFQYAANDNCNEGLDSAQYALMPITMTDPEKNPNLGSFVLSMSAIWQTNPRDTTFAQMPALWRDALELIAASRAQIFQTLGVNPAAITQQTSAKKKMNQAEIANEQAVDLLTTADAVTVIEQGILTPLLHRMLELDHQYRDKPITLMEHGQMGIEANMQEIPPIAMNVRHYITWFGVESARNAQQMQQQIAAMNVLRGVPPQLYKGHELDLVPVITQLIENTFGPRIAPLVFKDIRKQQSIDPNIENSLLAMGMEMPISQFDNLQEHMQVHAQALQGTGDPHGTIRAHLLMHQLTAAAMQQQAQQGQPGVPGAPGGAGPGIPGQAGSPRMGAQPGQPRSQGPAGQIHQDQLIDPSRAPR